MTDINTIFTERKAGIGCPMCPDDHDADVVAELASGRAHLQNDGDYRGYCILVFKRHAVEIYELTEAERAAWIEDVARIGRAITEVCEPAKLNVMMLGNMVPHLHCHIMPRYPTDPEWGGPPLFSKPADRPQLSDDDFSRLKNLLNRALTTDL